MKQERSFIEERIYFALTDLNKDGTIKELLKYNDLDEYINKAVLTKILNLNLTLNNLTISELYHIVRLINKNKQTIKAEDYFTDDEMSYAIENKNNLKFDLNPNIILKNVLYSKNNYEESWMCVVTYKDIYNWMKTGKLIYNMETQRQGVLKKVGRERIIVPYINEKSINDIKSAMLKGEFYSNMISFNVTLDYNYKLDYNPTDRTLIIDTNIFEVAVTDGWHRCSASVSAIEENKDLYGELFLKITNTTIEKAQKFIRQQAIVNVMDLEYLEKFNPNNKITIFINNINDMGSESINPLYRKIDVGINSKDTWIMFESFKEGLKMSGFIDDIIDTNDNKELKTIEKFIVDFFDNFYKTAENNNIIINENETLTDETFIMGLLITCHQYYKSKNINTDAMDKFIKKLKITKTEYTYNIPIKSKEKKLMTNKFKKLLEVE
jgi:hypothetical protein